MENKKTSTLLQGQWLRIILAILTLVAVSASLALYVYGLYIEPGPDSARRGRPRSDNTNTSTPTPTVRLPLCTPPSCGIGSVIFCPEPCNCQCATPTPTLLGRSHLPLILSQPTHTAQVIGPDLVVNGLKITLATGDACYTSTQLGVRVWFQNIGNVDAGPFVVEVNGVQQLVASGLAAGQAGDLWFPGYTGANIAFVDATYQVAETDETNNWRIQITGIPTLPAPCTPTPTTSCVQQAAGCKAAP